MKPLYDSLIIIWITNEWEFVTVVVFRSTSLNVKLYRQ